MKIAVSKPERTQFTNANGVWQDGQIAQARDSDETLWAILGHTNYGGITRWKGTCMEELTCVGQIRTDFSLGEAGMAFNGTRYPDGPRARGQFWPFGLWIDPVNDDFYLYIHNETGWSAGESAYTALGQESGEPDFRHIGLLKSLDQGATWSFVDWIITANEPCWTENYRPDGMSGGQNGTSFCLGAGDFCMFEHPFDGYMYIYYTLSHKDTVHPELDNHRICVARSPIAARGISGSWKKYYRNGFVEEGNCGKESPVVTGGLLPSVRYSSGMKLFLMTTYEPRAWAAGTCTLQLSVSEDAIHWSEPKILFENRKDLSFPYYTLIPTDEGGLNYRLYMESNGTDIYMSHLRIMIP